jgi:hypothetical protein
LSVRGENLFISLTSAEKVEFRFKDFKRSTSPANLIIPGVDGHFEVYISPRIRASDIETYWYACRRIRIISGKLVNENFVPPKLQELISHNSQPLIFDTHRPNKRSAERSGQRENPGISPVFTSIRVLSEGDQKRTVQSLF